MCWKDLYDQVEFVVRLPNFKKKKSTNKFWASLIAQLVKNLPAMQETLAWFLGWEDPPEKG